jgi:hypothetical protein
VTVVQENMVPLAISVREYQIWVAVSIHISYGYCDGRAALLTKLALRSEPSASVVQENSVAGPSVGDEQVQVSIAIEIMEQGTSVGLDLRPDRPSGGEVALSVVQEHPVHCHIVRNHDIRVAVAVQVASGHRVGGRALRSQGVGRGEAATAVVQEDLIALGPVPTVCDERVHVAVTVDIRKRQIRGQVLLYAEHEAIRPPEGGLLRDEHTRNCQSHQPEILHIHLLRFAE